MKLDLSHLSFLVVEDDSFQRWMLEQQLSQLKARRIATAPDGSGALEALRGSPVDVIISDLDMPGMDGMEFMRRLSELPESPWLVVSSAQDRAIVMSVESMAAAYGVRLLGSIAKPPTPAKLAAVLSRYPAPDAAHAVPEPETELPEGALAAAIAAGEICCWFQPKVEIATKRIVGAEALLRWVDANGVVVLPQRLLPEAERLGLMPALTDAVVAQACAACASWRREGILATVSFNMSLAALGNPHVPDALTATVRSYGLEPGDIVIEVTESAAATELGPVLEALARLRMRGFGLAIDDFGTGYASMQQLTRIPFTELKIDQSFVRGAADAANLAVLESSVEIARKLNLKTVAEGVQTEAEWRLVKELGCHMVQGWLHGKAMPLADFIAAAQRASD